MKNLLVILLSIIAYTASAQISFRTGSVELDTDLNTINVRASANFDAFKGDLSITYYVSEKKIEYMRAGVKMEPGEIYFALEIARLSRRPVDEIITIYNRDKHRGWGYIAKEVGIKPGSPEFHQLKNNASSIKNKCRKNGNGNDKGKGKGKNS